MVSPKVEVGQSRENGIGAYYKIIIVRLEVGETKNDEARTVYLDEELKEVFNHQWETRKKCKVILPYVFPNKYDFRIDEKDNWVCIIIQINKDAVLLNEKIV